MTSKEEFYERQADTIIQNMAKRRFVGRYCQTADMARGEILSMIPSGASVSFSGSQTLQDMKVLDALRRRSDINFLDRDACRTQEERDDLFRRTFFCDYYLMSSNAITLNGELVNIDGNGNRVAALTFGPKNIIIAAGMNKIAADLQDAIHRVRNFAAPPNCMRLNINTPCASSGKCHDCYKESICNTIAVTRRSSVLNRIQIILIGESLGY